MIIHQFLDKFRPVTATQLFYPTLQICLPCFMEHELTAMWICMVSCRYVFMFAL
eukprot:c12494_g2_i1 orf=3-161(-)